MDSGERGMNRVALPIITSSKEYWPSLGWNEQPPALKSCTLPISHGGWGGGGGGVSTYLQESLNYIVENEEQPLMHNVIQVVP